MKVGDLVRFFNPVDVVVWENQPGLVLRIVETGLLNPAVVVYFPKESESFTMCSSLLEVVD